MVKKLLKSEFGRTAIGFSLILTSLIALPTILIIILITVL